MRKLFTITSLSALLLALITPVQACNTSYSATVSSTGTAAEIKSVDTADDPRSGAVVSFYIKPQGEDAFKLLESQELDSDGEATVNLGSGPGKLQVLIAPSHGCALVKLKKNY